MKGLDSSEKPQGAKCYHDDCGDRLDLTRCKAVICCVNCGCGEYYCWRHKSKKHIPRGFIDRKWHEVC